MDVSCITDWSYWRFSVVAVACIAKCDVFKDILWWWCTVDRNHYTAPRAKQGTNLETISPSETSKDMGNMGRPWKQIGSTKGLFGNGWLDLHTLMTEWNYWHVLWSDKVADPGDSCLLVYIHTVLWMKLVNHNIWEDAYGHCFSWFFFNLPPGMCWFLKTGNRLTNDSLFFTSASSLTSKHFCLRGGGVRDLQSDKWK